MPRVGFSLQVKNSTKLVRRNMDNLRKALPAIGKFRIQEAGEEIVRRMSQPAKKITYPVNWDSVKQRIKVIVMILKKQGFLPYQPTHAHEKGWKMQTVANGVKVSNAVRGTKHLYGTMRNKKQSRIHVNRRPILRAVYDSVLRNLPKKVKESLRKVPKANG